MDCRLLSFLLIVSAPFVLSEQSHAMTATSSPPTVTQNHLTWDASAGLDISSDYDFRGLVLSHSWFEPCSTTFDIRGNYSLSQDWDLSVSWTYRTIDDGDDPWDKKLQKLQDFNGQNISAKNESQLCLSVRKTIEKFGIKVTGGYRNIYGGFGGLMMQAGRNCVSPRISEMYIDIRKDIIGGTTSSDSNHVYTGAEFSYAFDNISGWWMHFYTAYCFTMSSRLDMETLFHFNYATSYWDKSRIMPNNGAQSFILKVAMPIHVSKNAEVIPFISGNLTASGAKKLNDKLPSASMLRDFSIIGGVGITYHF